MCILILTFWWLTLVRSTQGHGRLIEPPSRASMWRYGYNTPVNYLDNQLFCGGYTVSRKSKEFWLKKSSYWKIITTFPPFMICYNCSYCRFSGRKMKGGAEFVEIRGRAHESMKLGESMPLASLWDTINQAALFMSLWTSRQLTKDGSSSEYVPTTIPWKPSPMNAWISMFWSLPMVRAPSSSSPAHCHRSIKYHWDFPAIWSAVSVSYNGSTMQVSMIVLYLSHSEKKREFPLHVLLKTSSDL